jgi:hypothetical protein
MDVRGLPVTVTEMLQVLEVFLDGRPEVEDTVPPAEGEQFLTVYFTDTNGRTPLYITVEEMDE